MKLARALPRRGKWSEFAVETLIRTLGLSGIGFVTLIFVFLLREGLPTFFEIKPGNLFGTRWYPTFGLYGTLPLLFPPLSGTLVYSYRV